MVVTQDMKNVTLQKTRELYIRINILKAKSPYYIINGILHSRNDDITYENGIITLPNTTVEDGIIQLGSGLYVSNVINGYATGGNVTIDATSDLRRTLSLDMVVNDSSFEISPSGNIWIDRYIQLYVGIKNNENQEIVWFNKGIFIVNQPTWTYDAITSTLHIDGLDLVSLLNGDRNGVIEGLTIQIPAGSNIRDTMASTLSQFTQFTDYNLAEAIIGYDEDSSPIIQDTPNDLTFEQGSSVWDIIVALRDIVPNYECYFDENGVFVYQPTPSTSEGIVTDKVYKATKATLYYSEDWWSEGQLRGLTLTVPQLVGQRAIDVTVAFTPPETCNASSIVIEGANNWGWAETDIAATVRQYVNGEFQKVNALYGGVEYVVKIHSVKVGMGMYGRHEIYADIVTSTQVSQELFDDVVISEQTNTDFTNAKNYVELYGRTHDVSYVATNVSYNVSNNNITLTVPTLASLVGSDELSKYCPLTISFTPTTNISNAKTYTINGISGWSNITIRDGGNNYLPDLQANTTYVLSIIYNKKYTSEFLGGLQAKAIAINTNPNSPLSINNIGQIRLVLTGGEYENITSDYLANQRAKWELYKHNRLTNNISLTCVPIYYIDVNKLVTYNSNVLNSKTQWIITRISTDLNVEGTQMLDMTEYYPYYEE